MTDHLRLGKNQTLTVVESTPRLLEVESTWSTGGSAPPGHLHPEQTEEFRILDGVLSVEIDGQERREYGPGETFIVPPRTPHRMWNAASDPVRANWRITPGLRTHDMFRAMTQKPGRVAMLATILKFRREFKLASVTTPEDG